MSDKEYEDKSEVDSSSLNRGELLYLHDVAEGEGWLSKGGPPEGLIEKLDEALGLKSDYV